MKYRVAYHSQSEPKIITLNGSKSISNRALIIQALCGKHFKIENLSSAKDTTTLQNLLNNIKDGSELDAGAAGTTFRFLTAYLALHKGTQLLTGSNRMKQRPIGLLVDALRSIGAKIDYLEKEGYPPLKIYQIDYNQVKRISLPADISSQFISALMLIAPSLPHGLEIELEGDIVSLPYLLMTKSMMSYFGADINYQNNIFSIKPVKYTARSFQVEGDWSAASYYYAIVAFEKIGYQLSLKSLQQVSVQGDQAIVDIGKQFGVNTRYENNMLILQKVETGLPPNFSYDFILCPDLAQTVSIMMAGLGIRGTLSGLKTLRIKETDRILALQQELNKVGIIIKDKGMMGTFFQNGQVNLISTPTFDTYEDHRMAMSLASLGIIGTIEVEEPMVVNKSYPKFWENLQDIGFSIEAEY